MKPHGYNNIREKRMAMRRQDSAKAVAKAIKFGNLPPAHFLICFDCDSDAQCYDHRDYSRPMDVWPVCNKCDSKRGPGRPYSGIPFMEARMIATEKRLGIYQVLK